MNKYAHAEEYDKGVAAVRTRQTDRQTFFPLMSEYVLQDARKHAGNRVRQHTHTDVHTHTHTKGC